MAYQKFDMSKLEKLNDPGRFDTLIPEVMWDALGAPKDARAIVEIGAGTGLFSARFARFAPEATVYAVDVAPAMIEWMRKNRAEVAEGRVVPVLAQESVVPLEDGLADVVMMINVHHELADAQATYRDALRLLCDGARLLAVDWAPVDTPKGPPQAVRISSSRAVEFLQGIGFREVASHEGLPWHWLVTAVK